MNLKNVVVIKEEPYRSTPLVNSSDDMVRVTLAMTCNDWHVFKRLLIEARHKESLRSLITEK